MDPITYSPIGVIHTLFKETKGTPIQAVSSIENKGSVEIFEEFSDGLKDLDGFSHITLIYHFHLSKGHSLIIKPFLDDNHHGVFATRSPCRPNQIGISTVELLGINGNILDIQGIDMLDGSPLLDIKPYIPKFDNRKAKRIGWLQENIHKMKTTKDDGRFQR